MNHAPPLALIDFDESHPLRTNPLQIEMCERDQRLLVVEDDEELLAVVSDFLQDLGFAVDRALDGTEALACLRDPAQSPPSAILLDLMMPGMNGWQFRREQLSDPLLSAIPVIVMSAAGLAGGLLEDALLQKPFGFRELRDKIWGICGAAG